MNALPIALGLAVILGIVLWIVLSNRCPFCKSFDTKVRWNRSFDPGRHECQKCRAEWPV